MDKFYSIDHIEDKKSFLIDCISRSFKVKVEKLDCKESFTRLDSQKTIHEILEMIPYCDYTHYVFILRESFIPIDIDEYGEKYIETGIRLNQNINDPDYFIFIYIDIKHLDYFIKEYNLKG